VAVSIAATAREAVQGAEVVITATSSTGPVIEAGWLARGAYVTAVGSDMPHKQDAAVAALTARLAGEYRAGRDMPLGGS
jgi:ornithine cyclodeaminase/alanine dehydrogenase-like protein (mu-crystallin family)